MADIVQLMDSLGRVLETKTPNIEQALTSLATAMSATITKITKITGEGKSIDTFTDLITDKGDKVKHFSEYLRKEIPDAFKELAGDIEDVSKNLKETAKTLESIQAKAKGGTATTDDNCPCQQILNKIESNIATLSGNMATGVSLEKSMTDLLGQISGKMTDMITAITNSKVIRSKGASRGMGNEGAIFGEQYKENKPEGTKVSDVYSNSSRWWKTMYGQVTDLKYQISEMLSDLDDQTEELRLSAHEVDAIGRGWSRVETVLDNIMAHSKDLSITDESKIRKIVGETRDLVVQYRQEKISLEQLREAQKDVIKNLNKIDRVGRNLDMVFGVVLGGLSKFGTRVIGGIVNDSIEWEKESSRMAATMTGAIHKAGGESKQLVANYRNLLEMSDTVIKQTHQYAGIVRKELVKSVQKGTRSLMEAKEATVSALAASWQVGASAENTADEFQKWNMELGMSATGATSLARTITTVAKTTGVMGDNLVHAVSAAREIAQLMKDTGLYSQETANNVVSWMASAQKFGVDKQVQNIFRASQGGLEAFMEASSETRNLLAAAGQAGNVIGGNADPQVVMEGVDRAIRNTIPLKAFPKGRMAGLPDLKRLTKSEVSMLDKVMKSRFGMKLGEAVRVMEAIQHQDPEKRLKQIESDLQNPMLTKGEQEQLKIEQEQLKIARDNLKLSKTLDVLGEASEAIKNQNDQLLTNILNSGKLSQQSVTDAAKTLSEKLGRQGKTFKDAMGKTQEDFTTEMNQLISEARLGNADSKLKLRELIAHVSDANKTADSEAKNNSNNMDKMESDQQRLNNLIQNYVGKPLQQLMMQAPIWTWYLTMMSSAAWSLYRAWTKGRISENVAATANTLKQTLGHRGSGFVHDIHVEAVVEKINKNIVRLSRQLRGGGRGGAGGTLPDNLQKKTAQDAKQKLAKGINPVSAVSSKDAKNMHQSIIKGPAIETKAPDLKPKMSGANALLEGAGKLTAIAAGVVALGVVLISATKAIMSLTGFNANDAQEVAWVLGTVIGAGAGALLAAAASAKVMEWANKTFTWSMIKDVYLGGLMLLAFLPAVAILGLALVGMGKLLSNIIEPRVAAEYAWAVASIMGAAGIVSLAILASAAVMTVLGLLVTGTGGIGLIALAALMLAGAAALLVLTPAMMLLAVAVIGMASGILKKVVDPKVAAETATATGSIMMAAAKIAMAVVLSAAALVILAPMAAWTWIIIPLMAAGTVALLALTPVVMGMAWAVINMASIMNQMVDPKWAAETATATADILWAAAKIAAMVVASAASLTVLSSMVLWTWIIIPLMAAGTIALLALTKGIVKFANVVLKIATQLPTSEEFKDVPKRFEGAIHTFGLLPKFIRDLSMQMIFLGKVKNLNYNLQARAMDFAIWFYGVSYAISEGVLRPIMSFPSVDEVTEAIDTLMLLTNSLTDLMDIMYSLSEILNEMGSVNIDFSALENVGGVFKAGRLELVIRGEKETGLFGGEETGETESWMEKMLGVFTGIHSPAVSLSSRFIRGLSRGMGETVDRPMNNISRATSQVGRGVSNLSDTVRGINVHDANIINNIESMKNVLNTTLTTGNSFLESIKESVKSFNHEATSGTSLDTHDHTLEDVLVNQILPQIGQLASATAEDQKTKATTNHGDFDRQVQARVERSRPSDAMMSTLEYLAAIAANTHATNESLQDAIEVLEDIRGSLDAKPGAETAASRPNKKSRTRPNFYSWQFGRFGDTSAKQYINSGR